MVLWGRAMHYKFPSIPPNSNSLLRLVERLDLLNLVVAAHEYPRSVMYALGDDLHHALHLTVECLATSLRRVSFVHYIVELGDD